MLYRIALFTVVSLLTATLFAGELSLRQTDTGYQVLIGNELFAGYITDFSGAPIVYPIVGPNGKHMTRDFPMIREYEGRNTSHPHQRSLWFTHGDVNGVDFWNSFNTPRRVVHQRFAEAKVDGQTAVIITENNWVVGDRLYCSDVRTLRFSASENKRIIDFDITITAEQDTVVFGDTKEGTFGIRVPEVIAVDSRRGGQFVNAEGGINEAGAWGKRSAWINYHGIMDDERVGIAILNHPSSFRYPTYWHTRQYGLFAANPFGVHDFERLQDTTAGNFTLAKGESFTLRYRVIFHKGDVDIAKAFEEYAR